MRRNGIHYFFQNIAIELKFSEEWKLLLFPILGVNESRCAFVATNCTAARSQKAISLFLPMVAKVNHKYNFKTTKIYD